jgi:hypothetical protein
VRGFKLSEPVLGDLWQESLRSAIAGLAPNDADDALVMLLPTRATPPREARPRTVFALRCLLEQPPVREATVTAVLDAAIDQLDAIDSGGHTTNTTMDDVLKAAYASVYADRLVERLIEGFVASRSEQRNRIGICILAALRARPELSTIPTELTADTAPAVIEKVTRGLESSVTAQRVEVALGLLYGCFLANGRLGFLTADQAGALVDALVSAAQLDEATTCAAMWALSWLTGARIRLPQRFADDPREPESAEGLLDNTYPDHVIAGRTTTWRSYARGALVLLRSETVIAIERLLQQPDVDPYALANGALALNRDADLRPINLHRDWIGALAAIADGAWARRELPDWSIMWSKRRSIEWLRDALRRELPQRVAMRVAQALGACGTLTHELVPSLRQLFLHGQLDIATEDRDEAMLYLAFMGGADVLIEAADTPPAYDDYLSSRGLFGLLLLDDVHLLASQLCKALPHADLKAYAYGLAGSNNRWGGHKLLRERCDDPNPRIRAAVDAAFANRTLWSEALTYIPG